MGAVVETPEFYPELTPTETLTYLGKLRGMSPGTIRDRISHVLGQVKMEEWKDQRIGKFSTGMKQRIAIAQALLHEPDLLILDEPSSGLDPRGVAEVREVIKGLKSEHRAVFMSSHQLYEVQEVCDRVALINRGKLLLHDDVSRLSSLRRSGQVEVDTLRDIPEAMVADLHTVPGVKGVRRPRATQLLLDVEGGADQRAALLEYLQGQGLQVHSFKEVGLALEDVYMDLIKESK